MDALAQTGGDRDRHYQPSPQLNVAHKPHSWMAGLSFSNGTSRRSSALPRPGMVNHVGDGLTAGAQARFRVQGPQNITKFGLCCSGCGIPEL